MTKIKNTKKGMAKKTLSMSLVVAMLATSNVPVWAAEFSDGTDAAFTAEAPVVEDNTTDTVEAQAVGDAWTVKVDMPTEIEWGTTKTVAVEIKDVDGNNAIGNSALKYFWKESGLSVTEPKNVTSTIETPFTGAEDLGKQYTLYIYDETGNWEFTSTFTVGVKDISNDYEIKVSNREYTGETTLKDAKVVPGDKEEEIDFDIDYTGDLVNVGTVNVTATPINTKLYKGTIYGSFEIEKAEVGALVDATLVTKEFEYTGNGIQPTKADVNVTDKKTGEDLNSLVTKVEAAFVREVKYAGDTSGIIATVTAKEDTKNFKGEKRISTEDAFKVIARDLSKVNVTVASMVKPNSAYSQEDLTITFKDANGKELNLGSDVVVEGLENAVNYGTYTLTIKPAKDNKNVTGQTTTEFSIFSQDINGATFDNEIAAQEYTGSQITPDVSKLKVELGGKEIDPADYTIEYGENVNAGKGYIYIVGQRTYTGSKSVVGFDINQAVVSEVKANDYVIINKDAKKADDYAKDITLVVKAKNAATPAKEFTLTEGTDYTVKYSYDSENKAGDSVKATIELKSNNFKMADTQNELVAKVRISNPIITDADIKMNKTSYEYTGAVITPDFDVVVNGKTLKKDTDYVIDSIVDSAKAGTATVYVTGKAGSDYDDTLKAKATFEVTAVSAEKTVVAVDGKYEYNGKAHKPEAKDIKVTLNGNDVTDQFDVTYGENINAGEKAGTVTVTPKKDNKNFVAGTSQIGTFEIAQKELRGEIKVYDARGIELKGDLPAFEYDGTEKTFAKVVFTNYDENVTADDYEIKYVNNVTGGGDNGASIVVIAKGNYKGNKEVTDYSTGTPVVVKNVAEERNFKINSKLYFTDKEVAVTDAEYAGPYTVAKPEIVVRDGNKVLVEGTDYEVKIEDVKAGTAPSTTEYKWTVKGKGVYKNISAGKNTATGTWKIVKKNVANLDIKVDLDENGETVLTVMHGDLKVDNKNFTVTLSEDKKTATVAATTGNKYYIGSTEVTVGGEAATVEAPMISNVKVVGNKATVILSEESDGATGYDYVISTDRDCINNKAYDAVNKNQIKTETTFDYVGQGTYYAYCHAWKRDENGKKVFSDWSNAYPFAVSAITPSQPTITSVKVDGSTVTVTYTEAENADGYDVVLGTSSKKVNGEVRPVNYGKLVKKNQKTTTVTFKNVEKGTYYVGLHAFNKTSEDGKKVFSQWSNVKKATVK